MRQAALDSGHRCVCGFSGFGESYKEQGRMRGTGQPVGWKHLLLVPIK